MKHWMLVLAVMMLAAAPARAQSDVNALRGMWMADLDFGPAARGGLTLIRDGETWRADLAGERVRFDSGGDTVTFALPSGASFRGRLTRRGEIEGFWLQAAGETGRQAMATPLTLVRSGSDAWRGEVVPLDERVRIFLRVDGEPAQAAFHLPELNYRGGAARFAIEREGDAVAFTAGEGEDATRIDARFADGRLHMTWPDFGMEVAFARATAEQAADFTARPPDEAPYRYGRPPETRDGWRTARARSVGFDEAALEALVRRLSQADSAAANANLVHSILAARRGRLVLEHYFFGFDRDTPHDTRSAGKTFSSVMLGALMREGAQISPNTRVYDAMADWGPFGNADPRKAEITLAQLMTHSSGLACDDNDWDSPGNEGVMQSQSEQSNWPLYTLNLPMEHDPGAHYAYCSGGINLAGAVLSQASGEWLPALFHRTIAEPLSFGRYYWNLMPDGEGYLGGGAHILPRDLLKLGQLYLDGGVWRGRRIVSRDWVQDSTAAHIAFSAPVDFFTGADGYAWHRYPVRMGDREIEAYEANGNGGQVLLVVPEYDLVVVFTGGNYRQGGVWGRWRDDIVGGAIIPALRD